MRPEASRRSQSGFSLVELIVVITILGIISFVLTEAMILGLKTTDSTASDIGRSIDVAALRRSFTSDAQSAALVSTGDAAPPCAPSTVVASKSLTTGVATLTTASAHGYLVARRVAVAGMGAPFDGSHTLTAVTDTTFSYEAAGSDVASSAAAGTSKLIPEGIFLSLSWTDELVGHHAWYALEDDSPPVAGQRQLVRRSCTVRIAPDGDTTTVDSPRKLGIIAAGPSQSLARCDDVACPASPDPTISRLTLRIPTDRPREDTDGSAAPYEVELTVRRRTT